MRERFGPFTHVFIGESSIESDENNLVVNIIRKEIFRRHNGEGRNNVSESERKQG